MREIKHRPYTLLLKNLALWLWSHVAYASVVVAAGAAAWFYNIDILMWMWQSAKIHTADTRVHTYMVWVTKEARDGVLVVATAVGWHKEKSMNSMLI